jgi:hypothetical protein
LEGETYNKVDDQYTRNTTSVRPEIYLSIYDDDRYFNIIVKLNKKRGLDG